MDSEHRERVAARFARLWKRQIRAEEGRYHRRANLERRVWATKRLMMMAMTAAAAIALLFLWLR